MNYGIILQFEFLLTFIKFIFLLFGLLMRGFLTGGIKIACLLNMRTFFISGSSLARDGLMMALFLGLWLLPFG